MILIKSFEKENHEANRSNERKEKPHEVLKKLLLTAKKTEKPFLFWFEKKK